VIKRHGSVSRQVNAQRAARETQRVIYANARLASIRDYQISETVKPIKFWVISIDSLDLIYITNMFLFFLYVSYKQRYRDAKSEIRNFHLRYVVAQILLSFSYFLR